MASRRTQRIASLLKQGISRVIISELSDPQMGFVTVVKVEPAPDLKTAKVFISVLGEEADVERTMARIGRAARFIRHEIAKYVDIRSIPELRFVEDKSVKGSVRVSRLITEVLAESRKADEGTPSESEGEPGEGGIEETGEEEAEEEDEETSEEEEPEES
jgi:ribosome-binding factor A